MFDFLILDVFNVYGIPLDTVSDNISRLRSDQYQKLAFQAQARPVFTSGYRLSAKSVIEQVRGSLRDILHLFFRKAPGKWGKYLSFALWYYNTSVHLVTGFKPYFCRAVSSMRRLYQDQISQRSSGICCPNGKPNKLDWLDSKHVERWRSALTMLRNHGLDKAWTPWHDSRVLSTVHLTIHNHIANCSRQLRALP